MSIEAAIYSRHSGDLVVPECKDGPTWGGSHLRLDYWVLRRSWTKPAMIGYEIKSSRADFLRDTKWQNYLPLCNELWFIADPKHILPGELPEGVGHLRLAGPRLITVRKAVWREIEPPSVLLTYILMCRAAIKGEHAEPRDETEYWRDWLATHEDKQEIGHRVAKAMREKYRRDVERVSGQNESLRADNEALRRLADALKLKGIEWHRWTSAEDVEQSLNATRWQRNEVAAAHEVLGKLLNGHGPNA